MLQHCLKTQYLMSCHATLPLFKEFHIFTPLAKKTKMIIHLRLYDGPVMEVSRPNSSKLTNSVAYRGPLSWNQLKPKLHRRENKDVFVNGIKNNFLKIYNRHQVVQIRLPKQDMKYCITFEYCSHHIVHLSFHY